MEKSSKSPSEYVPNKLAGNGNYTVTVDSDPALHKAIEKATGMRSSWFSNCESMSSQLNINPIAIFVDAKLSIGSSQNGPFLPKFRDSLPSVPIIITTNGQELDLLTEALAMGADDFVDKPINDLELKRRLDVHLGVLELRTRQETIRVGDMTIDTRQRSVTSNKGREFLSPTEIRLVFALANSQGRVVSRDVLKKQCWREVKVSDNALNRKLFTLRKRLQHLSENVSIRTIYGVGFIMEERLSMKL